MQMLLFTFIANYEKTALMFKHLGHVMRDVHFQFKGGPHASQRKYVALLKHCPALSGLAFDRIELNEQTFHDIPLQVFKHISSLTMVMCQITDATLKTIFSACDPLKLKKIRYDSHRHSDCLLDFIVTRMLHLEILSFNCYIRPSQCMKNVLRFKNLEKLKSLSIEYDEFLFSPLFIALENLDSLEELELVDLTLDENTVKAINNLTSLRMCSLTTRFKQMNNWFAEMSNFIMIECVHWPDDKTEHKFVLKEN